MGKKRLGKGSRSRSGGGSGSGGGGGNGRWTRRNGRGGGWRRSGTGKLRSRASRPEESQKDNDPGSNSRLPRPVSAHERRYPACQAIAVNTIQIPLRTIIGIAGIGFFFVA